MPFDVSEEVAMGFGARCGAATGPIPAEVRRQECLKLERTGASFPGGTTRSAAGYSRPKAPVAISLLSTL